MNCGSCGNSCGSDEYCSNGSCCGLRQTACASNCVDTSTDTHNCGRCAHDCFGGACASGQCQVVEVTALPFPAGAISTDADYVYIADPIHPLRRVPKDGGALTELTVAIFEAYNLAIDTNVAYGANNTQLLKADFASGSVTELANAYPMVRSRTPSLGLDKDYVYWSSMGLIPSQQPYSTIMRTPRDGGASLQIGGGFAYSGSLNLTLYREHLYWQSDREYYRLATNSLSAAPMYLNATDLESTDIAVDDTAIYSMSPLKGISDAGFISRRPFDGGTPVRLIDHLCQPSSFIMDDAAVYVLVTNYDCNFGNANRTLVMVPKDGGPAQTLFHHPELQVPLAQDERHLYISLGFSGLWRLAKP